MGQRIPQWLAAGPVFGTGVARRSNPVPIAHGQEQALRTQRCNQRTPCPHTPKRGAPSESTLGTPSTVEKTCRFHLKRIEIEKVAMRKSKWRLGDACGRGQWSRTIPKEQASGLVSHLHSTDVDRSPHRCHSALLCDTPSTQIGTPWVISPPADNRKHEFDLNF